MSKTLKIVLFVGLAGALIFFGREYDKSTDKQSAENMKAEQQQAAVAEQEAMQKLMEKLKIEDIVVGTGTEAKAGNTISAHYIGTLDNGTEFDNSYKRGEPLEFPLGTGRVIPGWDLGLQGMKIGGKRKLTIPPELGYGASGTPGGPIPPNATLHFTVELVAVK